MISKFASFVCLILSRALFVIGFALALAGYFFSVVAMVTAKGVK